MGSPRCSAPVGKPAGTVPKLMIAAGGAQASVKGRRGGSLLRNAMWRGAGRGSLEAW